MTHHTYSADEFDRILPPLPHGPHPQDGQTACGDGAEQLPLPLSDYAAAVWRGEQVPRKADGSVDRSEALWLLGAVLREAGLAARYVGAELAQRDEALGWGKYTDRPEQYAAVVEKLQASRPAAETVDIIHGFSPAIRNGTIREPTANLVDTVHEVPTAPCAGLSSDSTGGRGLCPRSLELADENAALRADLAAARRRIAELEQVTATQTARVRDAGQAEAAAKAPIGPASATILAAGQLVYDDLERGRSGDADGYLAYERSQLAAIGGRNPATVSLHMNQTDDFSQFFDKRAPTSVLYDPDTRLPLRTDAGTVRRRSTLELRPRYPTRTAFYDAVVRLGTEKAAQRRAGEKPTPIRERNCTHQYVRGRCTGCRRVLFERATTPEERLENPNDVFKLRSAIPKPDEEATPPVELRSLGLRSAIPKPHSAAGAPPAHGNGHRNRPGSGHSPEAPPRPGRNGFHACEAPGCGRPAEAKDTYGVWWCARCAPPFDELDMAAFTEGGA
jgi:hypothetical protein